MPVFMNRFATSTSKVNPQTCSHICGCSGTGVIYRPYEIDLHNQKPVLLAVVTDFLVAQTAEQLGLGVLNRLGN